MGAPQTIYNGGLLRARVRYFDADLNRPGLPRDVAALVEGLETDRTVVHLVNLNVMEQRRLIIQAGAFGEHEFGEVKWDNENHDAPGNDTISVPGINADSKYVMILLPPGKSIVLDMETKRFVNDPSYLFPWHPAN